MTGFAISRKPGDSDCTFVAQKSGICLEYPDTEALNNINGYVIAPFYITANCPITVIKTDIITDFDTVESVSNDVITEINHTATACIKEPEDFTSGNYETEFAEMMSLLNSATLDKVVLSRQTRLKRELKIEAFDMFADACQKFPRCYVALFATPQTGVWLIASPELLIESHRREARTMALAGTMPHDGGITDKMWSEKNIREQAIVSDYITDTLQRLSEKIEVDGPSTVRAAHLMHLRTDFRFQLRDDVKLSQVIAALHPTPAVCGLPRKASLDAINSIEYGNRRYYSGYSGLITPDDASLYMTLRCMSIGSDTCTLFAGGGLVKGSMLETEWEETEEKLKPMKSILQCTAASLK